MSVDERTYSLIPTHCSCCYRPLSDPTSVEFGMGPTCRGYYKYDDAPELSLEELPAILKEVRKIKTVSLVNQVSSAVSQNDSRKAAKALNVALAVWKKTPSTLTYPEDMLHALESLRLMHYVTLADRVGSKVASVSLKRYERFISVAFSYNANFVAQVKEVKGAHYLRASKEWRVPISQRPKLWEVLKATFPSHLGRGPKGLFLI